MSAPQHRRCPTRLHGRRRITTNLTAIINQYCPPLSTTTTIYLTLFVGLAAVTTASKLGIHIVRSPESTIAPLHDEVLFECELNLEPERLDWRFRAINGRGQKSDWVQLNKSDGYNITTGGGTSKLRIDVGANSVGEYQCVSWFGASALASIPARLTLAAIKLDPLNGGGLWSGNGRETHNQQLMSKWSVQTGNAILLKCGEVISTPPPVWSFYRDDHLVPSTFTQLSTGTLVLQNISPHDSGVYSCVAVNSITGAEIKMPQRLSITVADETPKVAPSLLITVGQKPITRFVVRHGDTAVLECPGIGNPIPKPVWSRPDAAIYNNRTSVHPYGLQILQTVRSDRGIYVCRLDNGIAPALVHTVRLDILEPPTIIEGPRETLTNEGESLTLDCQHDSGFPEPEVYWIINDMDTRFDDFIRTNGSRLIVRAVQKRHAGIVQCFVRNEVGEVSGSSLLQVNPKQIHGDVGSDGGVFGRGGHHNQSQQPLGTVPQPTTEHGSGSGGKKGHKKHKHNVMIPPSRPSVTRLADEKVMVRWSVPSTKTGLPIQFFKVQYRMLPDLDSPNKPPRSLWMTSNEDIPPTVNMYEVDNLKPDHYYRFRIAAVYSNNDNKLSNVSTKFLLQRGSILGPNRSHLIAPNLTSVTAISQTAVVLHWLFPEHPISPVDGFYAYYRPASTAGEYSKATVDGMKRRQFRIDNLEPGTAYEFKLQSFTASAASDFLAILTGKTWSPSTPQPFPNDVHENETMQTKTPKSSYLPLIAGIAGGSSVLLLGVIMICICLRRKRVVDNEEDANENKSHPDHIQAEPNGYPSGNGRIMGSPMHKNNRMNGIVPRMNITANPLSQDGSNGDKNRNVMELRFMPSSNQSPAGPPSPSPVNHAPPIVPPHHHLPYSHPHHQQQHQQTPPLQHQQQHQQQHQHHHMHQQSHHNMHHQLPPQHPNHMMGGPPVNHHHLMSRQSPTSPEAHRRTLDRSARNIHHYDSVTPDGMPPTVRRSNGRVVPGSPRVMRGVSSELLSNRSPMPSRAALAGKRGRLGSRTENMSSGSLNSIEV